ncbi:MAG: plasmid recombination protein [Clostridia bacterium]|nr:plasmid recombination protein [Clostridia bacterium]
MNAYKYLKHRNNNYLWNKQGMMEFYQNEIKPWEIPRASHATISVLAHAMQELHTVDDYLSKCEQQYNVDYLKLMSASNTQQTWEEAKDKLNAQLNKRKRNVVLACLQFGGNKEFWDGFPNEYEIESYFKKCYTFAVDKIGYLGTDENIICAVIITEPNRRNLFVYYLPVTPKWKVKIMSKEKNDYGTLLQLTDENGEPLYRNKENFESPLLCRTEFWKQRGGITSFSGLQEDFFRKVSEKFGAVRGKSTSPYRSTCLEQRKRFGRYEDDEHDFIAPFDDSPYHY